MFYFLRALVGILLRIGFLALLIHFIVQKKDDLVMLRRARLAVGHGRLNSVCFGGGPKRIASFHQER